MEPITYRLNPDGPAAAPYYRAVTAFTHDVLLNAEGSIAPLARAYRRYLVEFGLEDPRSLEEYTFELLNLGILWHTYGRIALGVEIAPFRSLAYLAEWRKKHQRLKPAIDVVRGVVMSFFLVPFNPVRTETPPRNLGDLECLVRWLDATGDFRKDALRFVRWLAFWASFDRERFAESMMAVLTFADWFEAVSGERMGSYTPNVTSFVRQQTPFYRWREDRFSCLRSRVEYHLNGDPAFLRSFPLGTQRRRTGDRGGRRRMSLRAGTGGMGTETTRRSGAVRSPERVRLQETLAPRRISDPA